MKFTQSEIQQLGSWFTTKGRVEFSLHDAPFSASGNGTTDDRAAIEAALAVASSRGGATILGHPDAIYYVAGNTEIAVPTNTTLDLVGGTIWSDGSTRLYANGDPGVAGGSPGVANVHFKRIRIGGPSRAATNTMRGPRIDWATDSSMQDIIVHGITNTCFNLFATWRTRMIRCVTYGGNPNRITFGFLAHMTYECTWDDCHVVDGYRAIGYQQKGGRNNVYRHCSVKNQTVTTGITRLYYGFWDRGDAPQSDSATAYSATPLTYPYATLGWDQVDTRRHSHYTVFEDCVVEDVAAPGIVCQEAIGTQIINPTIKSVTGSGINLFRLTSGDDSTTATLGASHSTGATTLTFASVDDAARFNRPGGARPIVAGSTIVVELDSGSYHVTTIGTVPAAGSANIVISTGLPSAAGIGNEIYVPKNTVLNADAAAGAVSITVVDASAFSSGGAISIVVDDLSVHTTTVSGAPVGTTITIADALPNTAKAGRLVSVSVAGAERDFKVIGGVIEAVTQNGIHVLAQAGNKIPGVVIRDTKILTPERYGIFGDRTDRLTIENVEVTDPNNASLSGLDGIELRRSDYPRLLHNVVNDSRGTPRMQYGIQMLSSASLEVLLPTLIDNRVVNSGTSNYIQAWMPGFYSNNQPAEGYKVTTTASTATDAWRCTFQDGQAAWISLTIIAQQSGSANRAVFLRQGLFYCAAGVVTQQTTTESGTNPAYAVESNTAWNAVFTLTTNTVRIDLIGAAATTITWRVYADVKPIV